MCEVADAARRALERRWRRGRRDAAWWRRRTLACIAVAVTLQGKWTIQGMLALTTADVAKLRRRMPRVAWRWARDWQLVGSRVLTPAVVRASRRTCGYGLGRLLRARW